MRILMATASAAALAVSGCAVQPLPDAARRIDVIALGTNQDPGTATVNIASWAFAESGRTHGDPVDAARAAASVDYLAGDLYANPRWLDVNPLYKQQMLDARLEVRQTLGIPAKAQSQQVVDTLLEAANAMTTGDPDTTRSVLASPLFTMGPERTYALLADMPYLPATNVATAHLGSAFGQRSRSCPPCD